MKHFDRWIAAMTLQFSALAQVALVAVMVLIVSNIILRRFLFPIPGTVEMVEFLGAIILGSSIAYCLYSGGHIFVDVLVQKISQGKRAAIDFFTNIIMLLLNSVLSWQMAVYGKRMMDKGFTTGHLGIPIWPVVAIVAVGFLLMAFVNLGEIFKAAGTLNKGENK